MLVMGVTAASMPVVTAFALTLTGVEVLWLAAPLYHCVTCVPAGSKNATEY